jgi:hypothetical protein
MNELAVQTVLDSGAEKGETAWPRKKSGVTV